MSRIIDAEFMEENPGFLVPPSVEATIELALEQGREARYDNTWKQVYDSEQITSGTTGTVTFFDAANKVEGIQMDPLLAGNFPKRQSFIARNFAVAFPTDYNLGDDLGVLDEMFLSLFVQNGEAENEKLSGMPFMFPAGGGLAGVVASGDFTASIDQQAFNNGQQTPGALFTLDVPVIIDEEIAFNVTASIPTAIGSLTTGRMFVVMHGDFFERIA